ncbi:uncharacterized protein LOC27207539 [Drosophila simulans]|uniref:uncharacterized protein LOC27207539 n=1 Tax=Drosophila simulans TaxID=7240 RepID=UPI00078AE1DD|nr:uncharacterized protein LOC27207539 [Drosophila simulans]KMZ05870.1 uncharacterized protein Dsimw501_GD27690, isoform E [Drosophila simulans]
MLHIIIIVALAVVVVIHKEQIVGPKKFLRIVTRKVNFKPQDQILSAIVITDNSLSKGGTAFLLKGGPPARFAMIAFRSDRNHGLNWRYMPLIYALHVQIQVNFLKNVSIIRLNISYCVLIPSEFLQQDEFSGGQTLVWI